VVAGLLDWAVTRELLEASPLQVRPPPVTSTHVSFLFDASQTRRLLDAAAALPDNSRARQRGPAYRAIFALCYGLGLRAGEACGLRLRDIDTRPLPGRRARRQVRQEPPRPARARIAGLVEEQAGRRRACGTTAGPDSTPAGRAQRICVSPG
jgi:integrase